MPKRKEPFMMNDSDLNDFDIVKKDGDNFTVIDTTHEGERRSVQGRDGKMHSGRVRVKEVFCGKKCKKCPHPLYAYINYRDGKKTREKYLDKIG